MRRDRGGKIEIEFLRDVAGEFEMLLLVLADRDMGRAIDKNIGGHQTRIGIKPDGGVLAVLARLLLELRHAVEPADARHAIEHPGELGMFGNLALVEHDMFFGIDAAGDEGGRDFPDARLQFLRLLRQRDRVQIDDAIDAIMGLLQLDEFGDRAEIISKMQIARRLHAGKNPFNEILPCQRDSRRLKTLLSRNAHVARSSSGK